MRKPLPVAITIAGVDSGGGAGVAADLKTFAALGVHGALAVTSVTAQNTVEVRAVEDLNPRMIEAQIEAVAEDLGVDAGKTGMLSNERIVKAVAKVVSQHDFPLVVDPVMIAKSGGKLLRDEAIDALRTYLIPKAAVVTPNAPEASRLTGIKVSDIETAKEAAQVIVEDLGAEAAVIKGGHLRGEYSIDVLYFRGRFEEFRSPSIETRTTHGTGCSFSAAIAAELAKGLRIPESVRVAKEFITEAIYYGLPLGKGYGPVNPMARVHIPAHRWEVILNLKEAVEALKACGKCVAAVVPEVEMNLGMALPKPYARNPGDVAALPGRIGRFKDTLVIKAPPEFGASKHIASAILAAMKINPEMRAAGNIAYNESIRAAVEKLGLSWSYFDRDEEPLEVKNVEGGTTPLGVSKAAERLGGKLPEAIFDYGEYGKEPLTLIFGRTAKEVAEKIISIAKEVSKE